MTVDGVTVPARLTLGALAELEASMESGSLVELVERFEGGGFSARDILALLAAGLRAGGWEGSVADLASAELEGGPVGAARAAAELLSLAFQVPE